jgi:hypothetical protein
MSPTERPSSVAGLRRGVGTALDNSDGLTRAVGAGQDDHPAPERAKPVRVTLNFPPDLFRQLDRWTSEAADMTGLPRVGVQDAVREMVRVITSGDARNAEAQVYAGLLRVRG